MNKNNFFKIYLSILLCCSCTKTMVVKTKLDDSIKYINPEKCSIGDVNYRKYKTKKIKNYIAFDEKNLDIFLSNFQKYKFATKKYINCLENNENYYKHLHE